MKIEYFVVTEHSAEVSTKCWKQSTSLSRKCSLLT